MTFQNPAALWWLLPLGGLIVALYLLRMRRKDLEVPASFLWPERTDEIRANSLFQKLKFSWLMVLQLLALLLLGLIFARPQAVQEGLAGKVSVIVLDASASMGALESSGETRLERGIEEVRGLIEAAKPGDRLALILAGPDPEVIFPLSIDPARQRRELGSIQGSDADVDISDSLRLAAALVGSTEGAQIILISDGAFKQPKNFKPGEAGLQFIKIGDQHENLAIQSMGRTGNRLLVSVFNYGDQPAEDSIQVRTDGRLINSYELKLEPGESWSRTLEVPVDGEVFEAVLENGGALKSDNYGVVLGDGSRAKRVLVVSPGSPFLERVLALEPNVVVDRSDTVPSSIASGPRAYDVIIFDGVPEEPVNAAGVLTFGSPGPSSPVSGTGAAKNPPFMKSNSHPVVAGVDLSTVYIDSLRVVQPKGAGESVADSEAGPIVVVKEGIQRQVFVGFRPIESDFPLSVSFPILVANAIEFLAGESSESSLAVKPGQVFALPANTVTVTRDGAPDVVAEGQEGRTLVRQIVKVGRYQVAFGGQTRSVYSSLRSQVESDLHGADQLVVDGEGTAGTSAVDRLTEIWKPLGLLALLVLAAEWWLFARRS